jgi:hypothetical protein
VTRIVFLDDYQGAVDRLAPLDRLRGCTWETPGGHLVGDALVDALGEAEVVVAMRERTVFDRALLQRLPALRLLCTTGPHNASIDLEAAADLGVTVSATGGKASGNTAELAWGLIPQPPPPPSGTSRPRWRRWLRGDGSRRSDATSRDRPSASWGSAGSADGWPGSGGLSVWR